MPFEERDHLIEMDPETFFTTEHHRPYPMVLAHPDRLDIEWARDNLTCVWRAQAKKAVVKAWMRGAEGALQASDATQRGRILPAQPRD